MKRKERNRNILKRGSVFVLLCLFCFLYVGNEMNVQAGYPLFRNEGNGMNVRAGYPFFRNEGNGRYILLQDEEQKQEQKEIREPSELYAQAAVLMDADSGRILFAKNGQEERAMASTTKIMTCILALEYGKLDEVVTASTNAA